MKGHSPTPHIHTNLLTGGHFGKGSKTQVAHLSTSGKWAIYPQRRLKEECKHPFPAGEPGYRTPGIWTRSSECSRYLIRQDARPSSSQKSSVTVAEWKSSAFSTHHADINNCLWWPQTRLPQSSCLHFPQCVAKYTCSSKNGTVTPPQSIILRYFCDKVLCPGDPLHLQARFSTAFLQRH